MAAIRENDFSMLLIYVISITHEEYGRKTQQAFYENHEAAKSMLLNNDQDEMKLFLPFSNMKAIKL